MFQEARDRYLVGATYNYTQPETFTKGSYVYYRENNSTFSGVMGYMDLVHIFNYRLQRNIKVNYLDNRTGEAVHPAKVYNLFQNDLYEETPKLDIKKEDYTYRYIKTDGDPEKGIVGLNNLNINYYYDIPLAKVGLEKLQIYTAKSDEVLPVKVKINTKYNYDKKIKDMSDSTKTITVALYQGDSKLDSKKFVAKDIPSDIDFKVPEGYLNVDENKPFTVKLEGFDKLDFHVEDIESTLTTSGYTSTEGEIEFDVSSKSDHKDSKSYVVMTEITPTTEMKSYYETFTYEATPLMGQKSGYGVETDFNIIYTNELGNDYQLATEVKEPESNFYAPNSLRDNYLDYETVGDNMKISLVKELIKEDTDSNIKRTTVFKFPHMNVEKMTGNLFTDKQVADGDSRIRNDLRNGGNQFFSPVWAELGEYAVNYETNEFGAHKMKFKLTDSWELYAQMMITMDSQTKDKDEIVFMPVNAFNPFSFGKPDNWTDSDVQWLKY